jgi:dTDP-glucose 4,6-dehydratase
MIRMQKDENKTIIITGGAGFIGSWLCEDLLARNRIICIDSLITGKKDNISHLANNKNFTLIKHDITKEIRIDEDIDYIFHLASPASPIDYQKLQIETMLVNSFGTYNMLKLALDKKARFLLASTSEVYGDPLEHPQKEEYWGNVNPIGERSCYDESKRFAESLTMNFHRKHNLDVGIVRIFNTYGPRMRKDDGRVMPNFINQALNNREITINGDGSQTRSFCYISDMVNGLKRVMFSTATGPINLGNQNETKIIEVAKLIKKLTNSRSAQVFRELPEDDPVKRCPDISKARKLGWEPRISLEEGLLKTIEYFRNSKDRI